MSGSNTGAKWLSLILVYFVFMTLIVSLVTFTTGGNFETDIGFTKFAYCDDPRDVYEPYNPYPIASTADYEGTLSKYRKESASLDCSTSVGVLSNDSCSFIEGCIWGNPPESGLTTFIVYLWNKITFNEPQTIDPTCYGNINGTYYGIESHKEFMSDRYLADDHENTINALSAIGSVCNHPNVTESEDLCDMFSCTWTTKDTISNMDTDDIEVKSGSGTLMMLATLWSNIQEMASFRFDFGIESVFMIYFLNFFIFWLPFIGLILSIYMMVRG